MKLLIVSALIATGLAQDASPILLRGAPDINLHDNDKLDDRFST